MLMTLRLQNFGFYDKILIVLSLIIKVEYVFYKTLD